MSQLNTASLLLMIFVVGHLAYVIDGSPNTTAMVPSIVGTLRRADDLWILNSARDELIEAPLFAKVAYADEIVALLADNTVVHTSGYVRNPDGHDLNCVAGRAAWILATTYGIEVGGHPIDDKTTPEDLRVALDHASGQLRAYNRGIAQAVRHYRIGDNVQALKARFQGRLLLNTPNGLQLNPAESRSMTQLLDEWFPIGKQLQELEQIIGLKPACLTCDRHDAEVQLSSATGLFDYRCSGGLGGTSFQFSVENGTIVDVNIRGLD